MTAADCELTNANEVELICESIDTFISTHNVQKLADKRRKICEMIRCLSKVASKDDAIF